MTNFKRWLDNFWYHNKITVIIVTFFVAFGFIMIFQMAAKDTEDINLIYGGPHIFTPAEIHNIEYAFEQVMNADYNGDGKNIAVLLDMTLLSDEQAIGKVAEAEAQGVTDLIISSNDMREMKKKFDMEMFSGESVICLLDPYWFNYLVEAGGILPLKDALGAKPDNAINDYGINLFETNFGKYFTALTAMPEDTVLCMRRMTTTSVFKGVKREEKRYGYHLQMFKDAMNFTLN
jgi:hypothetical protein